MNQEIELTEESIDKLLEHYNPHIQESIKSRKQFMYIDDLCYGLKIPESYKNLCDFTLDMYIHYRKSHGNYLSQINSLQDVTIEAYEIELTDRYNRGELKWK